MKFIFKPMPAVPDGLLRTTFFVCVCEAKLIFGGILWIVRFECEELGIWSLAILITSYIWPIYKTFSIGQNPFIEIYIEIFIRTAAAISLQLSQCTTYRRIYSIISL